MYPAAFSYFAPSSVDEALALLREHGDDAKILAGGHSLIPTMKLRLAQPRVLIDLGGVAGLAGVRESGSDIVIGAMTTHNDVAGASVVRSRAKALAEAAEALGDTQVRNRGTIGGSSAHADPNADEPVPLTAFEASFTIVGPAGRRTVPANEFFIDVFTTALQPDEVLTEITLPSPSGVSVYTRMRHPASGFQVVSCAAVLTGSGGRCDRARIAMGGIAGAPLRATSAEQALAGQQLTPERIAEAAKLVTEGADPADDLFAPADYKRAVAVVYAERALTAAAAKLQ